jgi:molecular chaperone DnaK (HSP70)
LDLHDKRYIIGIDLGTTNSAVSYVDLEGEGKKGSRIHIFRVPQLTGSGEFSTLPVLPSFLYIPGEYDIAREAITIPWKNPDDNFVGAFAREHGSRVPARLVSSAKSWLCHANADRRAKMLPRGSGEEVPKVSPVQTTAYYLDHIKKAWNNTKGDEADLYLENQAVTLTVPASFDEVARDLTLEAAAMAGLENVTLLEEPLAAFYSWLIGHEREWNRYVEPGELILVCDVGGGTTDFTLITLREAEGSPRFERIAVGDHLILGGDNIDLALARRVEARLSGGKQKASLSGDRWKALTHQCRGAKESILDGEAESKKITLMGKGKKLIAETLSAELGREEVTETVLEGFFPLAAASREKARPERKGITEFGLPYEPEPAVTRHIGWFLEHHRENVKQMIGRDSPAPDLILFNGGSLKAGIVQERIREAIRHWFQLDDPGVPRVLENPDPDLSVALGAAYYGLVKIGQGVRVGSGSPRSYYLGLARKAGDTEEPRQAICLVERGLDEGSRIELPDKEFEVLTNQPVGFDLFSSSYRSGDRCGDLVTVDETMTPLPPIRTVIQFGKKGVQSAIPVRIEAEYTEMGTLAIWCRSSVTDHRWRLQFQLRDEAGPAEISEEKVFDETVVADACELIQNAFSPASEPKLLDSLVRDIADLIDRPKEKWPLGLIRKMADQLLELIEARTHQHREESRWLNLTGFCLRPGFGDGFDPHRIKQIWKIYKSGPIHANNAQVRTEWWIMWRRIAGGLKPGQQRQFIQDLSPAMIPKKGGKPKAPHQEELEIWMAVANMERLLVKDKISRGRQLLSEIGPKKSKPQFFWSLSRLGARELLYGPVDRVVPPQEVAGWIESLMEPEWRNLKPVWNAVSQMARKTGDRVRDLDPERVNRVLEWMAVTDCPEPLKEPLIRVVPIQKQEENTIFGESLPTGIKIRT